jgi:hypothetical protein
MNASGMVAWVEEHPTESIVIGGGGVLLLMWFFGFFSGSSSSNGSTNLASAYYAAEAQQAVVGGQIQMATIAAAAQTAQAQLNDNAATAIGAANDAAAIAVNGQNASSAATINQSNNDAANYQASLSAGVATAQANDQLLATYSNNATSAANVASNNWLSYTNNHDNNTTSLLALAMNTIIPTDQKNNAGGAVFNIPGFGGVGIGTDVNTVAYLTSAGFTPAQATNILRSRGIAV